MIAFMTALCSMNIELFDDERTVRCSSN